LPLLFALYGAPWVLKMDNGSAFIADRVRWFLHRAGVHLLYSPPCTPAYNGAVEAGNGSLKTRTKRQCLQAGHPGPPRCLHQRRHRGGTHRGQQHGSSPPPPWLDAARGLGRPAAVDHRGPYPLRRHAGTVSFRGADPTRLVRRRLFDPRPASRP
jgi:hypothetical protein